MLQGAGGVWMDAMQLLGARTSRSRGSQIRELHEPLCVWEGQSTGGVVLRCHPSAVCELVAHHAVCICLSALKVAEQMEPA